MTVADAARSAAVHFEAKKDALTQKQDGVWKLAFTVQPGDVPVSLLTAAMGTRYVVALVEVGDDEQPVAAVQADPPEPQTVKPKRLSQQCAMICNDARFWRFLSERNPDFDRVTNSDECAERVRDLLCVQSRSVIDEDRLTADLWRAIYGEYQAWLMT